MPWGALLGQWHLYALASFAQVERRYRAASLRPRAEVAPVHIGITKSGESVRNIKGVWVAERRLTSSAVRLSPSA